MENGSNLGKQLEAMVAERISTQLEFGVHVRARHKGRPATSCHPCVNFKQIILLQDVRIQRMTVDLNIKPPMQIAE